MEVEGDASAAAPTGTGEGEVEGEVEITGVSKESEFSGVEMEGFVSAEHKHSNGGGSNAKNGEVLATPAVRRVSKEHNVDLSQVRGTGRDGRITKEDVLNYVSMVLPLPPLLLPAKLGLCRFCLSSFGGAPSASASAAAGTTETIDLTPVQKAMFRAMTATLSTPHFAYSTKSTLPISTRFENCSPPPSLRNTLRPPPLEMVHSPNSPSSPCLSKRCHSLFTITPCSVPPSTAKRRNSPVDLRTTSPSPSPARLAS